MSSKWDERFAELKAYKKKYGHCRVPKDWPENQCLARWVREQRKLSRKNQLKQARFQQLDKIGFIWNPYEYAWEESYTALIQYKRAHGDCRVPTMSKQYPALARWVRYQRVLRREGKLSEERIRRLDALGFVWKL